MYNLARFNQRRRGYVLVGEGNSQQIEGEERLTWYGYNTIYLKKGFIFHVTAVLFADVTWCGKYATQTKRSKCSLKEAEMLLIQVIKLVFIVLIAFHLCIIQNFVLMYM